MMKDDFVRRYIKYRNKEIRQRVYKLPHIWWLVAIFLVAVGLFIISFFTYKCASWFSGVLVSVSCGCFTGLTFYFLANIRNNKERKLQKEYVAIKRTFELLMSILSYTDYYRFYKKMWPDKHNIFEDGFEILSLLDELENARNQISLSVYDNVPTLGYDPIDRDNMNSYREKLNSSNDSDSMKKSILWIGKELLPVADELQTHLREREDQITFIGNYFF